MIHPSEIQSLDCITHQNRILFRVLRKLQRGDPNLYLSFVDQRSISPIETASVLLGKFRWFSSIIDLATDLHPVRITGFCFFGRENVRCPLESILPVESIAITHFCFEKQTGKNSGIDDLDFQFLSWTQSRILANAVFEWLNFESARSKVSKTNFAVTPEVSWHPQGSPRTRKSVEPKYR